MEASNYDNIQCGIGQFIIDTETYVYESAKFLLDGNPTDEVQLGQQLYSVIANEKLLRFTPKQNVLGILFIYVPVSFELKPITPMICELPTEKYWPFID